MRTLLLFFIVIGSAFSAPAPLPKEPRPLTNEYLVGKWIISYGRNSKTPMVFNKDGSGCFISGSEMDRTLDLSFVWRIINANTFETYDRSDMRFVYKLKLKRFHKDKFEGAYQGFRPHGFNNALPYKFTLEKSK